MLSRRSLFSLFASAGAIAAAAKVHASPVPEVKNATRAILAGQIPEPELFNISTEGLSSHSHIYTPVNIRSDGSIRHRQHHPVDFPKR